jgi:exopolysaccharide biosynthesis operon protein EpsL
MNKINLVAPVLALTGLFLALPAAAQQPPATDEEPPASAEQPPPEVQQPPPVAVQEHPVMVLFGSSVTWDSNVFHLPSSVDAQAQLGRPTKSDRISTTYAGLRVDKPYAQQRFLLELTETAYRYDNFPFLDFNALQYQGSWQWHFTPRVSGTLAAERSEALVNYTDFRDPSQRNVRTLENRLLSVDAWLFGGWHLLGAARQEAAKNTVPFVQLGSFRVTGGEGGVKYAAGSGSSVTFNLRSVVGHFNDRVADPVTLLDDGFRRSESELLATWIITGKSTLDARLARVDYRSSHFAERDFTGSAARLRYRWLPTAKLSLNLAMSRDLQPWQDSFASYRVDQRLSFGPRWQLGARTALALTLDHATFDFRNPVVPSAGPQRHDAFRGAQLAVDWQLLRNVTVKVSLQHNQQTSTDPAVPFNATVATLDASLMF